MRVRPLPIVFALTLLAASLERPASAAEAPSPASRIRTTVSGDPATPAFVTAQIDAAVTRAFAPTLPAGARVEVDAIMPAPQILDRGFHTSFTVDVTIDEGPAMPRIAARTTVDVDNADVPGFEPGTLAFRDDPERIVADGVLSRTVVDSRHPARLYYYHQNVGSARRFCVVFSANDSVRTRVHVVAAASGPNIDVMSTGHAATKSFLMRKPRDEGRIFEISGGRPYLERDDAVSPGDVVVGALDLQVLDGGPVTVTVLAVPTGAEPAAYLYTPKLPDDGHGRHGDYDLAGYAQWIVGYTIGGPDAAYTYGSRGRTPANRDAVDRGHDFGDYGVLQRVTFDLANPGPAAATVYLYEKPLGGDVRSSFLVNGELTETGCVRLARRYAVASYAIAPHSTAALDVVTMTDGGSNYPLELGVTTTAPLADTPAISAPEGCFPKPASSAVK